LRFGAIIQSLGTARDGYQREPERACRPVWIVKTTTDIIIHLRWWETRPTAQKASGAKAAAPAAPPSEIY
jgi:hypothetical protein